MAIPNIYSYYIYGLTTERLRVNLETTMVQLSINYEKATVIRITDGNNGVHHFYDYVYGVLRHNTYVNFFLAPTVHVYL